MNLGTFPRSFSAFRRSATRRAALRSVTYVFGQSASCSSCFDRARGRAAIKSSRSLSALGSTCTGLPARRSSLASKSATQSPKQTRTPFLRTNPERFRNETWRLSGSRILLLVPVSHQRGLRKGEGDESQVDEAARSPRSRAHATFTKWRSAYAPLHRRAVLAGCF